MKFYFDGDSFTYGGGLQKRCGIDPTQVRWSKIVSDYFDAEEINVSEIGAPNDRVLRHLFVDNFDLVRDCDCIFIQLTFPIRNEFWSDKYHKWFRIPNPHSMMKNYFGSKHDAWLDYYSSEIYSDKYGMTRELVAYNSIVSYLKLIGKPFYITGLSHYDHINYDYHFGRGEFDRIPNDRHPSVLGHQQIAEKIVKSCYINVREYLHK